MTINSKTVNQGTIRQEELDKIKQAVAERRLALDREIIEKESIRKEVLKVQYAAKKLDPSIFGGYYSASNTNDKAGEFKELCSKLEEKTSWEIIVRRIAVQKDIFDDKKIASVTEKVIAYDPSSRLRIMKYLRENPKLAFFNFMTFILGIDSIMLIVGFMIFGNTQYLVILAALMILVDIMLAIGYSTIKYNSEEY